MSALLKNAGFRPEVDSVPCVCYVEYEDQEKARAFCQSLPPFTGSVVDTDPSSLPPALHVGSTVLEKDCYPFVVACGFLLSVWTTNTRVAAVHRNRTVHFLLGETLLPHHHLVHARRVR